jgi:hypothetical protein
MSKFKNFVNKCNEKIQGFDPKAMKDALRDSKGAASELYQMYKVQNQEKKNRICCPECDKPFDMGIKVFGRDICDACVRSFIRVAVLNEEYREYFKKMASDAEGSEE